MYDSSGIFRPNFPVELFFYNRNYSVRNLKRLKKGFSILKLSNNVKRFIVVTQLNSSIWHFWAFIVLNENFFSHVCINKNFSLLLMRDNSDTTRIFLLNFKWNFSSLVIFAMNQRIVFYIHFALKISFLPFVKGKFTVKRIKLKFSANLNLAHPN